ncbi:hypothetical protein Pla108_20240 [Botrimarina colliarenosi]|uniref:Prepilin-type N-terminal cleavage/methylation domain-containing protein n=1 Tax=Botrimarina colliarenosi TaxID=2528001 RepID=A0A5C6AEL9_9BACT|nr:hypothetical protein [Botrimarina colliarenosi]TWT97870.1 hypothetical protein Pla108_20240 [Botrimarina colliarenosi]
MRRRRLQPEARRGVTLLEVMTAATLAATMMTASFVVLRSSYAAWTAHEADLDRAGNATAVLRHLVQNVRQCAGVVAITAPSDDSGSLTVVLADGATWRWDHSGTSITLSINGGASQPLAEDIQQLTFTGYEADGLTPTTEPNDVQAVHASVTTQLPAGGARTVSSYTWVRSW